MSFTYYNMYYKLSTYMYTSIPFIYKLFLNNNNIHTGESIYD